MSQRSHNGIDFWRGYALLAIFINHIPGIYFDRFTHRNIGYSDSAELFVFLAGWSVRLLLGAAPDGITTLRMILRVGARGVTLYAAQILITMLAIAMLASAALFLDNPLLLQWNNTAIVFEEPLRAHIGLVILSHQLGYFDILPLYVVLMFWAVPMVLIHRFWRAALLPLSLAIYAMTLVTRLNLPNWPMDGDWFFNPFSWQFIFVLGFVFASEKEGPGAWARRNLQVLRLLGGSFVIYVLIAKQLEISLVDLYALPPAAVLFFSDNKTYLAPLRLLHALAMIAFMTGAFPYILRYLQRPVRFFCLLGRNSLYVFCVASLLSLFGQIARFYSGGSFAVDAVLVVSGIILIGLTGWLAELRDRLNRPVAALPKP